MNEAVLDQARAAYRSGDFAAAATMFSAAKDEGDVCGEVDHLRGNSLMRLGRYTEAAEAYGQALADSSYGKKGALLTNRGKALFATGDFQGAAASFTGATKDASYATPYKAQLGLGQALQRLGNPTEAGVAFRAAAIDGTNPAPAGALASLGDCFVALQRPEDAVEAYRTALDFATPRDDIRSINAGLGRACSCAGRFNDALDAFGKATSDGIYHLTPEQQADFDRAHDAVAADAAISAAPASAAAAPVDPLDPLGKSGNFMPDPSDTGFFTLSESEMIQQDKRDMKVRRKHRHTGLKVFLVILLLLVAAACAAGFAYMKGYGYPSQQSVISDLFQAASDGTGTDGYLAPGLDDSSKSALVSSIPKGATPTIEGMDASMSTANAKVKVTLSQGGELTYDVTFARKGIGWTVAGMSVDFGADGAASATAGASTGDGSATADGSSSDTGSSGAASSGSSSSSDAASAQ